MLDSCYSKAYNLVILELIADVTLEHADNVNKQPIRRLPTKVRVFAEPVATCMCCVIHLRPLWGNIVIQFILLLESLVEFGQYLNIVFKYRYIQRTCVGIRIILKD